MGIEAALKTEETIVKQPRLLNTLKDLYNYVTKYAKKVFNNHPILLTRDSTISWFSIAM